MNVYASLFLNFLFMYPGVLQCQKTLAVPYVEEHKCASIIWKQGFSLNPNIHERQQMYPNAKSILVSLWDILWLSCYLQCPQTITQHTFTGTSKRLTQEMEVFSYSLYRDSWVTISQPYIVFFFLPFICLMLNVVL